MLVESLPSAVFINMINNGNTVRAVFERSAGFPAVVKITLLDGSAFIPPFGITTVHNLMFVIS